MTWSLSYSILRPILIQKMKLFFTILFLFFPFSEICFSQTATLQLTETLTIGEDQSNEPGYIFGQPENVQVDSNGNIYVSERSDNTIRVFSSEGEYQTSFGGRGRGPGEFSEITDFRLDNNGNLVALDRTQSKVVMYDPSGEIISEHSLPRFIEASALFIFPTHDNEHYYLGYINLIQQELNGHFLHLFDNSFENKISEHYDLYKTYFDGSIPLEESLSKSYRKIGTQFNTNQIAIVPNIYTGSIYTFDTESLNNSVLGEPIDEFYEKLNWEQRDNLLQNSPDGLMLMSGHSGRFIIRMKASNFGLVGNQNLLAQFYGEFNEEGIIPKLNIYSSNGSLLLNQNLSNSDYAFVSSEGSFLFLPVFLDDHYNLYVIDYEYQDSYPAIRVFETNLGELLEQ